MLLASASLHGAAAGIVVVVVVSGDHLVVELVLGHLVVGDLEHLLQNLRHSGGVRDVELGLVGGAASLLAVVEVLEVASVLGLQDLVLLELLDLVGLDLEGLSSEGLAVEAESGLGGLAGLLEADEGGVADLGALAGGDHLDVLDGAVGSEDLSDFVLGVLLGESLDEEVASPLGLLQVNHVLLLLDGSLKLALGESDVELLLLDLGSVHLLDGLSSALGSGLAVGWLVADEGELSLGVFVGEDGEDVSELAELLLELLLVPGLGELLDVNVVLEFLLHVPQILGVPGNGVVLGEDLKGLLCLLLVLEADESVTLGLELLRSGDHEGLDLAVRDLLLDLIEELLVRLSLVDSPEENVLLLVGVLPLVALKSLVVGKHSDLVVADGGESELILEVLLVLSALLDGQGLVVVELGVLQADESLQERLVHVLLVVDDRALLKEDSGGVVDSGGDFGGAGGRNVLLVLSIESLGEIVDVDEVLLLALHVFFFFF
mmetsp:Transcript_5466/g.9250  ORF Transcript_5466/g.9250 Transcript_5466/m.9250 type:complete len:490 (+) Transcript_5466:435-1904(+)